MVLWYLVDADESEKNAAFARNETIGERAVFQVVCDDAEQISSVLGVGYRRPRIALRALKLIVFGKRVETAGDMDGVCVADWCAPGAGNLIRFLRLHRRRAGSIANDPAGHRPGR